MSDREYFEISIPADNDGYILMQCQHCGEYFKCTPTDLESDEVLFIHCPSCGLISRNYLTKDVIELARAKITNYAIDKAFDFSKEIERKLHKIVQTKAGKKPKKEHESPIKAWIDEMWIEYYPCCKRYAKINPLLKMSASYCPFCGVIKYANE